MTSKSPDHSADRDSTTPTLERLRAAVGQIDRRHAEGDLSGFVGMTQGSDDGDDGNDGTWAGCSTPEEASSEEVPTGETGGLFAGDPERDKAYSAAKKTAMNILSMRDHSVSELRTKLQSRDYPDEIIEELLLKLQKSRLLNDEEFAARYVRGHRERRKLSRGALKRELVKKGVDAEIISEVVDDIDGEEELARQVAMKKAASCRGLDRQVQERRILGMLARRGFSSSVCIKVTREVLSDVQDDD